MQNKFISTSRRVFLVKFRTSTEQFIVQDRKLFDLVKHFDGQIDFIKMSETYNIKFVKCPKSVILRQFSWDTEVIQYFKNLPYFKGVKF